MLAYNKKAGSINVRGNILYYVACVSSGTYKAQLATVESFFVAQYDMTRT